MAGRTIAVATAGWIEPPWRRCRWVLESRSSGSRLLVHTPDSDAALRVLLGTFPQARDIEVTSARLEDAFLALTAKSLTTAVRESEETTMTTTPAVERRHHLPPPLHYTLHSAALTAKTSASCIFSVGMPLILYVVFTQMCGTATTTAAGSTGPR